MTADGKPSISLPSIPQFNAKAGILGPAGCGSGGLNAVRSNPKRPTAIRWNGMMVSDKTYHSLIPLTLALCLVTLLGCHQGDLQPLALGLNSTSDASLPPG